MGVEFEHQGINGPILDPWSLIGYHLVGMFPRFPITRLPLVGGVAAPGSLGAGSFTGGNLSPRTGTPEWSRADAAAGGPVPEDILGSFTRRPTRIAPPADGPRG